MNHILLGALIGAGFAVVSLGVIGVIAVIVGARMEQEPDEFAAQRTPGMGDLRGVETPIFDALCLEFLDAEVEADA